MGPGRLVAWLGGVGLVAGVVAACVELEGSLGSDCIKNQDCQSGVCSALHCAAAPPLLDGQPGSEAADASDAEADGSVTPESDGPTTPIPDATAPTEAAPGNDARSPDEAAPPVDAPADAVEEGSTPDAPSDAPTSDARADSGETG